MIFKRHIYPRENIIYFDADNIISVKDSSGDNKKFTFHVKSKQLWIHNLSNFETVIIKYNSLKQERKEKLNEISNR